MKENPKDNPKEARRDDLRGHPYLSTDCNEYAFAGSGLEGERYDNPEAFPPAPAKTFNQERSDLESKGAEKVESASIEGLSNPSSRPEAKTTPS